MNKKQRHIGFTLIEMLVVVGIVALLSVLVIPNTAKMLDSYRFTAAHNLIKTALAQAQAHAAKTQKYAGIRFQFDSDGWQKGTQYLVLIENQNDFVDSFNIPHHTPDRYVAVPNAKPSALPTGICVISGQVDIIDSDPLNDDIENDYLDDDVSDDPLFCLNGASTFSIIFSPSGQLVVKAVEVQSRHQNDNIFGSEVAASTQPPTTLLSYDKHWDYILMADTTDNSLWCDKESSTTGLYIVEKSVLQDIPADSRYSSLLKRYISNDSVERILINIYTGTIIENE